MYLEITSFEMEYIQCIQLFAGITDDCSSSAAAQSSLLYMSRYFQTCQLMSSPEVSRHVKVRPEICRYFQTCPLSSVQTFPEMSPMSGHAQICLETSRQ